MKGRILKYSVSVAILATMLQATPTFAQVTQGQINATQGQIDNLETKIQQLDNQITVAMDKSQKLDTDIKRQQGKIDKTKLDIGKAAKDLENHKHVYSSRLRGIQAQGQQPMLAYAELLLSSKNISEFLTRSTDIMEILQSDSDLMNTLNKKEQALKNAENRLHNQMDNLKKAQSDYASEQKRIEASKQEIGKELAANKGILQQQQAQQATQIQQAKLAAQQAQQAAAKKYAEQQQQISHQVQNQIRQDAHQSSKDNRSITVAPSTISNDQTNSATADQVIATAERYLGVPYVWGGTTPSGFDCSGLMQYVFRSVGINLPRTAAQQQNVGVRISPSQVQKGDLVFEGDPAYHVGMYIGGGQWIQAPETGDVVKISSYNPSRFTSAARVLN